MQLSRFCAIASLLAILPWSTSAQVHYGVSSGWCSSQGGQFVATGRVGTDIGECRILPNYNPNNYGGGTGVLSGGGGGGANRAAAALGVAGAFLGLLGPLLEMQQNSGPSDIQNRDWYRDFNQQQINNRTGDLQDFVRSSRRNRSAKVEQCADYPTNAAGLRQCNSDIAATLNHRLASCPDAECRSTLGRAAAVANCAANRELSVAQYNDAVADCARTVVASAAPTQTPSQPPQSSISATTRGQNRSSPGTGSTCNALGGCDTPPPEQPQRSASTEGAHGGAVRPAVRPSAQQNPATTLRGAPADFSGTNQPPSQTVYVQPIRTTVREVSTTAPLAPVATKLDALGLSRKDEIAIATGLTNLSKGTPVRLEMGLRGLADVVDKMKDSPLRANLLRLMADAARKLELSLTQPKPDLDSLIEQQITDLDASGSVPAEAAPSERLGWDHTVSKEQCESKSGNWNASYQACQRAGFDLAGMFAPVPNAQVQAMAMGEDNQQAVGAIVDEMMTLYATREDPTGYWLGRPVPPGARTQR